MESPKEWASFRRGFTGSAPMGRTTAGVGPRRAWPVMDSWRSRPRPLRLLEAPTREPAAGWRPMGGSCACGVHSRSGCGISTRSQERSCRRCPPRRTFPAGSGRTLGSASPAGVYAARPPSFLTRHTPEAEDRVRSAPVRGIGDPGGRTGPQPRVPPRSRTLRHQQVGLRVWVRIRGPPSRLSSATERNFELAHGVSAADSLSEMQGRVPRTRFALKPNRKDAIHTPLLFSLDFNTALLH